MIAGNLCTCVGPMFSGKTSWLIDGLRAAQSVGKTIMVFIPGTDTRSHDGQRPALIAHTGESWSPVSVIPPDISNQEFVDGLGGLIDARGVIGVDEIQFFHPKFAEILRRVADCGANVWVSGLLRDATGKPWETSLACMGVADLLGSKQAVCSECGRGASETHRRASTESGRIVIGGGDVYAPMCRGCWRQKS